MSSKINDLLDQSAGKAQNTQGESLATFLASLTTSGGILALGIVAYIPLKRKFPERYFQRANQGPNGKWTPTPLSLRMLLSTPDPQLKHASGLENYFFDRYMHTLLKIFILLGAVILPVLLPLNLIDGRNELGGVRGLDRLSYSNVRLTHTGRYWVHLVLAVFTITSVCYTIQRELRDYARLQSSLNWDAGSCLLFTSRSAKQLSESTISRRFHKLCGGIYKVKINKDLSSLRAKLRRRDALIRELETAETILIMKANNPRNIVRKVDSSNISHRPSMRLPLFPWLPSIPLIGSRVDYIHYLHTEVARYNLEIEWYQLHPNEFPPANSAFVQFHRTLPIPLVTLALKARIPPTWTLKQATMANDTIWNNVSISWSQQCIQTCIVYFLVALLTLGFAFPVAIIGSLSQIEYLINLAPWLRWIPNWLVAVIQGVLPPAMLALITAAVPSAFRLLANTQGHHSRQVVENHVQIYYFTFLFVQVFLTVSLSAGITTLIVDLKNKITSTPVVLAQNLPKACNYFFSYFLIHTFTTVASTLLEVSSLLSQFIFSPLFDKTARAKWERSQHLGMQNWGIFLPVLTNAACIGLIYSVIAPLILVFSIIYFGVLWLLYRSYPPKLTEPDLKSSSLFYPTAIRQLFTGVYFLELCLTGLFFLVRNTDGKAVCTPQAVIMIFATVLTILFHCTLYPEHKPDWLPFAKEKPNQIRNGDSPEISLSDTYQDEALTSARPTVWIPKDELGVADDEIRHIRKTYDSIWISNEGASLDAQGMLRVWGGLPVSDGDYQCRH